MEKSKKIFKSTLRYLGIALNVLLIAVILINVYTIAMRLITKKEVVPVFGISTALVETGSMEGDADDSISGFSLIFMIKASEYDIGDVITFDTGDSIPTTHRIVGIDADGFITKGDFNNREDTVRVKEEQIIGKVFLTVPGVGYFIHFMRTPLGSLLLVLVCFLLVGAPTFLKGSASEEESAPAAQRNGSIESSPEAEKKADGASAVSDSEADNKG